jgi:hypothetical protein
MQILMDLLMNHFKNGLLDPYHNKLTFTSCGIAKAVFLVCWIS